MPFHRGADLPGIGMKKFDLAANGGAGVGFKKRAIGGNLAQAGRERAIAQQNAHASPTPARGHARFGIETSYRSAEHTSELQSLMPISYAVLCLKKTNNT